MPASISAPDTVVLVEDHEMLRDQLATLIGDAGMRVLAAVGTMKEGHRAIIALRPRVAVLDNHLPDGYGVDLCRTLTTESPDVNVIICSADVTPTEELEARSVGAAVVPKSIRGAELLDALDRARGAARTS
jgi:two-component system response regulator DevR